MKNIIIQIFITVMILMSFIGCSKENNTKDKPKSADYREFKINEDKGK